MGAYYNGKNVRAYYQGRLLGAYYNGKLIWKGDHKIETSYPSLSWKWDETDVRIITITAGDPPFGASFISGASDFNINLNDNQIEVSPKGNNTTATKKTASIRITDSDGDESYPSPLEQDFTLQVQPLSLEWEWNEVNLAADKSITILTGHVPISWSIISGASDFVIKNYDDNTASIYPKGLNSTTAKKTGTLRITDSEGYTIDVSLMQDFTFMAVAVGEDTISVSNDLGATWT